MSRNTDAECAIEQPRTSANDVEATTATLAPRSIVRRAGDKPRPIVVRNITIEQLTPAQLHAQWGWLRRGAIDILSNVKDHTEWVPEDLYAALRYPQASNVLCFICSRNLKALGWMAVELQQTKYGKLECFVWCGWSIPPAERQPGDDVEGAREQLHDYVRLWAKSQNCSRVTCLSSRALEHIGWTRGHSVYYIPL
jgi:hypothetical protein